jgi:hypothetical protein
MQNPRGVLRQDVSNRFQNEIQLAVQLDQTAACLREIPRPAGENAGLRDDAKADFMLHLDRNSVYVKNRCAFTLLQQFALR